jgi:hypothetical protein
MSINKLFVSVYLLVLESNIIIYEKIDYRH